MSLMTLKNVWVRSLAKHFQKKFYGFCMFFKFKRSVFDFFRLFLKTFLLLFFKRSYKRRDIPLEIYELVEITEKIKKHSDVYNFKSYRTSLCGDKLFFHFCFRLSITNLSSKQEKGKENSSKK